MTAIFRHTALMAAFAAIVVFAGCASPPATLAAPPAQALTSSLATAPQALKLEGVPALPASLLASTRRYNGVAGHTLADWHPGRREMLVLHRAPGSSTTQLFRLLSPMGELDQLTSDDDPVASAQWEPRDGRYIVFSRGSGGDEVFQLYRLDPDTRQTLQFTPAGQRHAAQGWIKSRGLLLVTSVPIDRTAQGGTRSSINTTLSMVNPGSPASWTVLAELPGGGWGGAVVSPDETQIAITQYRSANESEVWLIPIDGGERRRLLPKAGETLRATHGVRGWSKDGRSLYVSTDRAGEFDELVKFDIASGSLTRLTAQTPWDVEGYSLREDGKRIAISVNVDGRDELRVIDANTGAALPLPVLPGGSITRGLYHRSSGELAFVLSGAQGPGRIHTVGDDGRITAWTQPTGAEGLNLQTLPNQQIVRWISFDGRSISGVLTLPPARFTGKRPVVMLVHGGPEGQAKQGWQGRYNHLVQELGVALFEPNVRGSSGYGKTFLELDNGRLREDSVKDLDTAISWMATQPQLDASRVLVMGGSYGGYMALAASTRLADRIAGAVATVGISNWVTFLQNTESYRRDLRRVEYGDEREPGMREFLLGISPLTHVDSISKPLFVLQGRNDPRVPWTESEQMVRSLQKRGSPVWYMLADNEGHGFVRRENVDYAFAATVKFIEQTLKP